MFILSSHSYAYFNVFFFIWIFLSCPCALCFAQSLTSSSSCVYKFCAELFSFYISTHSTTYFIRIKNSIVWLLSSLSLSLSACAFIIFIFLLCLWHSPLTRRCLSNSEIQQKRINFHFSLTSRLDISLTLKIFISNFFFISFHCSK